VCLHHLCRKCLEQDHGLRGSVCPNTAVGSEEICPNESCKRKHHRLLHLKPMERLRMKSYPVPLGRQECQKEENDQQEVPALLLEVQRDQLTVLAGP
jgi:hypothetical protein